MNFFASQRTLPVVSPFQKMGDTNIRLKAWDACGLCYFCGIFEVRINDNLVK